MTHFIFAKKEMIEKAQLQTFKPGLNPNIICATKPEAQAHADL
jgi:hypothetical protein